MACKPLYRIFLLILPIAILTSKPVWVGQAGYVVAQVVQPNQVATQDETVEVEAGILLKAQDEAEIGELVRLDASDSSVDGLTWKIIPGTTDFEVIENGRRAFFSSRVPGEYLVILAAAKDGKPYLEYHTIEVIGYITPDDSLVAKVRQWGQSVSNYEGKQNHAKALAGVFRKLATADDVDVKSMLEATATANSAVLGAELDKWITFLEPLGVELDRLSGSGGLATREQYEDVWLQIAKGLDGVK